MRLFHEEEEQEQRPVRRKKDKLCATGSHNLNLGWRKWIPRRINYVLFIIIYISFKIHILCQKNKKNEKEKRVHYGQTKWL